MKDFSLDFSLGGELSTAGKIYRKVKVCEMLLRSLKVLDGAKFGKTSAFVGIESKTLAPHAFVFAVARVPATEKVYLAYTDDVELASPKVFPMESEAHAEHAERKVRDFLASKGLVDFHEALKNAE